MRHRQSGSAPDHPTQIRLSLKDDPTDMNDTVSKALIALAPVGMLLIGSAFMLFRERTVPSILQLLGAGCLLVVVVIHICEGLQLLPSMHWGDEHSMGHYFDIASAGLGLTLFPLGYVLDVLTKQRRASARGDEGRQRAQTNAPREARAIRRGNP
jgi:hypothetical protein